MSIESLLMREEKKTELFEAFKAGKIQKEEFLKECITWNISEEDVISEGIADLVYGARDAAKNWWQDTKVAGVGDLEKKSHKMATQTAGIQGKKNAEVIKATRKAVQNAIKSYATKLQDLSVTFDTLTNVGDNASRFQENYISFTEQLQALDIKFNTFIQDSLEQAAKQFVTVQAPQAAPGKVNTKQLTPEEKAELAASYEEKRKKHLADMAAAKQANLATKKAPVQTSKIAL